MEFMHLYSSSVLGLGAFGLLALIQLLVADVAGLKAQHTPGSVVGGGHDSFHFRAHRAHANMNESVGVFVVLVLFAFFSGANSTWTGMAVWAYVGSRSAHAVLYYLNIQTLRSVAFGLSFLALVTLFVIAVV